MRFKRGDIVQLGRFGVPTDGCYAMVTMASPHSEGTIIRGQFAGVSLPLMTADRVVYRRPSRKRKAGR